MTYRAIQNLFWQNKHTGRTIEDRGSPPAFDGGAEAWVLMQDGYAVQNTRSGTRCQLPPFATRELAAAQAATMSGNIGR